MRFLILSVLFLSLQAWANADDGSPVIVNQSVIDEELGKIQIRVTDIGEPVYEPMVLEIGLLCKDMRAPHRRRGEPKLVELFKPAGICAWGGHSYDKGRKILTVKYGIAALVVGDAPCEMQPEKRIDIKKLCARWR